MGQLAPWQRTTWCWRVERNMSDPATPFLYKWRRQWQHPPNRWIVGAGMMGAIRFMWPDERLSPILLSSTTLSAKSASLLLVWPCNNQKAAIGREGETVDGEAWGRRGVRARIKNNKTKNKTAFTLLNNLDQSFPKGPSLSRVYCQIGPCWS